MNERELLERAAKAAGIQLEWVPLTDGGCHVLAGTNRCWNPLTDDGDVFRLAVKMHVNVEHLRTLRTMQYGEISAAPVGRGDCLSVEPVKADAYAAARRAIVQAVASLAPQ
jgi:hypothetical protein